MNYLKLTKSETAIYILGWSGIALNSAAVLSQNKSLFLYAQTLACVAAFLYNVWLYDGRVRALEFITLFISILAAVIRNEFVLYAGMIIRSVNYQVLYDTLVKEKYASTDRE